MSLTITATASGAGSANGILLAPLVFTGASATQDGATAASETVLVPALALTPDAAGSIVVGAVGTGASAAAFSNPTGHVSSVANSTVVSGTRWGVYRSGPTSGRARTYGWNTPAEDSGNIFIAQAEIMAAAGATLALDASTPAVASTSGAKTETSASFTPPAGAVIVVAVLANWAGSGDVSVAVSDSAAAYTWTQLVGSGSVNLVSIWVGISDAVTLSVSASLAAMAPQMTIGVPVTLSAAASLSAMAPAVTLVAEGAPPGYPGGPLDALLELYLGGAWVDVTAAAMPPGQQSGSLKSGQAAGAQQLTPASLPVALDNPGGDYSPRNAAGPYAGSLKQNTPARLSFASPFGTYLRLEGDGPSYAWVADTSALHVTGSFEARIEVQLSDWRGCCLAARYGASGTPSWIWGVQDDGVPEFGWHDSGGTAHAAYATAPLPYLPGDMGLRVTLDVTTGTVTFYYGAGIDGSWTQLGDPVASGATSVIAGDQPLTVGYSAYGGVLGQLHGLVSGFRMYSGIATGPLALQDDSLLLFQDGGSLLAEDASAVIADAGFGAQVQGATGWTDGHGRAWLLSGLAQVSSRDYRLHGELGSIVPQSGVTGGAKAALAVAGRTRRMQQGRAPSIASAFKRAVLDLPGVVAYWPMEESGASGAFGAAVGDFLMVYAVNGSPGVSPAFECSAPLPQLGTVGGPRGTVGAYTGGTAWTFRFPLKLGTTLPSSGTSNIARVFTSGAVAQVDLNVDPDGSLYLVGTNGSATVFTVGPQTWDGLDSGLLCSIEATPVAGGSVQYNFASLKPGDDSSPSLGSPPVVSGTFGNVTQVQFNSVTPALSDTVAGHAFVQSEWTDLAALAQPLNAWRTELAADRFARISAENEVSCRIIGSPGLTVAMGPQPQGTLWALYKDIAWTEQGLLFEPREVLGIGLRTRASMIGQPAAAVFSFADANLPGAMLAADDDTDLINDLTATMPDGTTYRVQLDDWSANSVSDLPVGRGRYAANAPQAFNVADPAQLPDVAAWYLRVSTTDAARYRQVGADFGIPAAPVSSMARLRHGDRITLTDVPAVYQTADIDQVATGATEAFGPGRALTWDCIPYLPYSTPAPSGTGGISGAGGGGTGGGGVVVPGYAQTLIDDFSGSSLNPDLWITPDYDNGISVSGGVLTIEGISDYEQVVVPTSFDRDLSTGIYALKLSQSGTGDPGTMWFLGIADNYVSDDGNAFEFQTFPADGPGAWYSWAFDGTTVGGDTGDQDILSPSVWHDGDWLGIGNYGINGGDDVHVYKSSDGVTWSEIGAFTVTGAINLGATGFYFGTNFNDGAGPSTYVATVDDVSFFTRQGSASVPGEPVSLFSDGSGAVDTIGAYGGTIGVEIAATESGTVNGVYLSAPDGIGLTGLPSQIALWRTSGPTLVTSQAASWGEPDESGRVFAPFDSPPTMSGATDYMAGAFGAAGSFGYTASASWPVTSGPLTGVDGGFYSTDGSMDYPSSQQSGWSFGLDVSFTPTGSAPSGGGGGGGGSGGLQYLAVYESNGNFPEPGRAVWPFGNATSMAVDYFFWAQDWASTGGAFITKCIANGLTPCCEIEAWHGGDAWNVTPTYDDIMGGTYDTWLLSIGTWIAAADQDVLLIILHEFNISGQYPWAYNANATIGYGSGPGGSDLTPAQWIDLWSYIKAKVNSTAGGHAKFVWACAAFTGGTSISPGDYWPASDRPDFVGVDGYPKTTYAEEQGWFAGEFQATFDIIRGLGWSGGIGLAEINLPQMESTGGERIEDFVADMAAAGVNLLIEFDDTAGWGLAAISSDQISRLLAAIAANYT